MFSELLLYFNVIQCITNPPQHLQKTSIMKWILDSHVVVTLLSVFINIRYVNFHYLYGVFWQCHRQYRDFLQKENLTLL